MNLLEIRTQFTKLSGRYDLVDGSFADNGADYYLKAGIKFLDREVGFDKETVKETTAITAGDYQHDIEFQRVVQNVFFITGGETKLLTYQTPLEMRQRFANEPFGSVANGTTTYWTMEIDSDQLSTPSIVTMPPSDSAGSVEVWFKRNTPFPSLETGTNFWMSNFEHVAVNAGLYMLEVGYRNMTGARDWLAAIRLDLVGIEKDNVEDDAGRAEEMIG